MNAGQILETHLGRAARGTWLIHCYTVSFDGAEEPEIRKLLKEAGLPEHGKAKLYDGRTGEPFSPRSYRRIYLHSQAQSLSG